MHAFFSTDKTGFMDTVFFIGTQVLNSPKSSSKKTLKTIRFSPNAGTTFGNLNNTLPHQENDGINQKKNSLCIQ